MNIAYDLDGVFFDQEAFQFKKGIKYFKKQYIRQYYNNHGIKLRKSNIQVLDLATGRAFNSKKEIDFSKPYITMNSKGYNIKEVFMCSDKEQEKFWYKNMLPYALFAPFREDAVRIDKQLHEEGNKNFINSARAKADEDSLIGVIQRGIVIFRFKLRRIPYEKMVFCSYKDDQVIEAKVKACNDNNIDISIDDHKDIAVAIKNKTKAISLLFATRNNAEMENTDIPRYTNFSQLYYGIRKIQEKEKFKVLSREEKSKMTPLERENYYKAYREHLKNHVYNEKIIRKREKRLMRLIKYGKWLFDAFFKYEVIHPERIPKEKGITIAINHRSLADIPIAMSVFGPRPYHPMLKAEFLGTIWGRFFNSLGCNFVIREDKSSRELTREMSIQNILMGSDIILCPESTRNKTDRLLLDFSYGAVSISQNSGGPLYFCAIYKHKEYPKRVIDVVEKPLKVSEHDNLEEANKIFYNQALELLEGCKKYAEEKIREINEQKNANKKVKKLLPNK